MVSLDIRVTSRVVEMARWEKLRYVAVAQHLGWGTLVRRKFYVPFCDDFCPPELDLSFAMRADDGLATTSGESIIQGLGYVWVSSEVAWMGPR